METPLVVLLWVWAGAAVVVLGVGGGTAVLTQLHSRRVRKLSGRSVERTDSVRWELVTVADLQRSRALAVAFKEELGGKVATRAHTVGRQVPGEEQSEQEIRAESVTEPGSGETTVTTRQGQAIGAIPQQATSGREQQQQSRRFEI
ncbi:hypothetical protein NOCA240052 [metagenome]|uniref:Uncharacterized protein n=1 Tax=metagenome TaxID=256318 RepID=A0A2P2C5Q1_9ZZZZ